MDILAILIQSFWIIAPAYIANASALLTGGGKPIDGGKNWKDGKRILGDGKTWQGLLLGTLIGVTSGFALASAAPYINSYLIQEGYPQYQITNFLGFPYMILILFSICFGALFGDLFESFLKRRIGINRGEDWIPFDQLDFILGVLITSMTMSTFLHLTGITPLNWFFTNLQPHHMAFLLIVSPFIHITANYINRHLIHPQPKT